MSFKRYFYLVESETLPGKHLWIACTRDDARRLMESSPTSDDYFALSQQAAEAHFTADNDADDEPIVLEFKVRKAEDGNLLPSGSGYIVNHPRAVRFQRVVAGVVDDAFAEDVRPKLHELDEVALGGLQRCTAVTCNALLTFFHKPGLTLSEVPETDVGVLEILTKHGLAYAPVPQAVGRTVQQFAGLNQRGAFCLVTPGHAMALINQELFDAENRGPDGRKIIEAYVITS